MKLEDLLKQARSMQAQLGETQDAIKAARVTGESGGGLVRVTLNGAFEALRVEIDPMTADEERGVLEDLVAAAINDAVRRVEALQREKMGAVARGLGLPPGLNLPS
ncbi:MAG: YbaB/EbfC family nucleoid-associated protein [Gammaproteobacteria bacterium]|nr:YbaB/EbfC family nucleoid-associated protein [Gammaproteobacteria bacterium]